MSNARFIVQEEVGRLLEKHYFYSLEDSQRASILGRMLSLLECWFGVAVLEHLSPENAEQFVSVHDSIVGQDAWFRFWNGIIPDVGSHLRAMLLDFEHHVDVVFEMVQANGVEKGLAAADEVVYCCNNVWSVGFLVQRPVRKNGGFTIRLESSPLKGGSAPKEALWVERYPKKIAFKRGDEVVVKEKKWWIDDVVVQKDGLVQYSLWLRGGSLHKMVSEREMPVLKTPFLSSRAQKMVGVLELWMSTVDHFEKSEMRQLAIDHFSLVKPSVLEVFLPLIQSGGVQEDSAPGYVVVSRLLGKSLITAARTLEGDTAMHHETVQDAVGERVVRIEVAPFELMPSSGALEALYDDGVFLSLRYSVCSIPGKESVELSPGALIAGLAVEEYVEEGWFRGLDRSMQSRVRVALEQVYVFGRLLESHKNDRVLGDAIRTFFTDKMRTFNRLCGENVVKV